MKRSIATFLLFCSLPEVVEAHSFVRYVSTPITPPEEFRWWFPISATILLAGTFVIIWRLLNRNWLTAIGLSVCTVSLFAFSFFMFGSFAAGMTTAPPPGLGPPHLTFWGMGWQRVGFLFVRWNLYGCGFLIFSIYLVGGRRRTRERFKRLALYAIVLYATALAPYIATGALVHGWAGGYVHGGCENRLKILNAALVEYSKIHDGQFPIVEGMDSLLIELSPYIPEGRLRYSVPIDVCPLAGAYERHPKHYVWNTTFSGSLIQDLDPDPFYFFEKEPPISCPYHKRMGNSAASTLREYIMDIQYGEDSNSPDEDDGK